MKKLLLLIALLLISKTGIAEDFQCSAFGTIVPQIPVSNDVLAKMGVGGGIAIHPNGRPVTLFDRDLLNYTEEFRNQVLAHECSHHQLGHVHIHSSLLPKKEITADCRSMFLLQEQLNYSEKEFKIIFDTIRSNGLSAGNRVSNIQSCGSMERYRDNRITRR